MPGAEPAVPAPSPAKPLQPARWEDLPGWTEDDLAAAWPAFQQSCRGLAGKPQWPAWRQACEAAKAVDAKSGAASTASIRRFFETQFQPYVAVNPDGNRDGLVTGYYEPLLAGARARGEKARFPLHGVPKDLLTIELGDVIPELKGSAYAAAWSATRLCPTTRVPTSSITPKERRRSCSGWMIDRALLPADPGLRPRQAAVRRHGPRRLRRPERAPYQSIGRVLIERGELLASEASMQGIQAWARANPAKLDELLNSSPSYVFFRELSPRLSPEEGPLGALGVPLLAERTIAIDPRAIPLGAPVFLATTRPNSEVPLRRLMMAQDTGGAIKGCRACRFLLGLRRRGRRAGRTHEAGRADVGTPAAGAAPK